jgi:hypothetical protein
LDVHFGIRRQAKSDAKLHQAYQQSASNHAFKNLFFPPPTIFSHKGQVVE